MKGVWVPPDTRDEVIDFVHIWAQKTEIKMNAFIFWLGLSPSKFYDWERRYGRSNEHNGLIPRDFWLEGWERKAIVDFYLSHPLEGYRRIAFMYRVLKKEELLHKWSRNKNLKGKGFHQPCNPHEQWHVDISYLNIRGTFYYLCSLLDGYSRYIVHWEIRESMREVDVAIVLERAREKFPGFSPRIISDRGPQFMAKEFKELIRITGMSHVFTSPHYPQSNGKKERWFRTLKSECLRPKTPLSLEDAKRVVSEFVEYYNTQRLHSAIGYITPKDKLEGREEEIFSERDRKLEQARERRKLKRQRLNEDVKEHAFAMETVS